MKANLNRPPERVALAQAIDRHRSLSARYSAIEMAISNAMTQIFGLREKREAAQSAAHAARHQRVQELIDAAGADTKPPRAPETPAANAEETEIDDALKEVGRIRDKLLLEQADVHAQIGYSEIDLHAKARAVCRGDAATRELVDGFIQARREFIRLKRVVDHCRVFDLLSEADISRLGEEQWPELDDAKDRWEKAVTRLEDNADAELPRFTNEQKGQ